LFYLLKYREKPNCFFSGGSKRIRYKEELQPLEKGRETVKEREFFCFARNFKGTLKGEKNLKDGLEANPPNAMV
jgi:hypothetical protein